MKRNRVSDYISEKDIESWINGDVISIIAGTGKGKSTLIKTDLYSIAEKQGKKILFLIHRKNSFNQFKIELEESNKLDTIELMTYQTIENKIASSPGNQFDYSKYDYIVCDEFHYFLDDANFNMNTELSLDSIINQRDKIIILMSATGIFMLQYLKHLLKIDTKTYEVPHSYDFIEKLYFINDDSTYEKLVDSIVQADEKAIIFMQKATDGYNLHKEHKEKSLYNCGRGDKHYKYVDTDKIQNMLLNEYFDENILITTAALDTGVSIKDTSLKHIIIDMKDIGTLIQCIGRKRILSSDDKVILYIRNVDARAVNNYIRYNTSRIEKVNFLINNSEKDYILKYGRDVDKFNYIYDVWSELTGTGKAINMLAYRKTRLDIFIYEKMKELGKHGYKEYISDILRIDDYYVFEYENKQSELDSYLNSILGTKLYDEDKVLFYKMLDNRNPKNNIVRKSVGSAEEYINDMFGGKYSVSSHKDNRTKLADGSSNPNKNKNYLIVEKSVNTK